jgi:hypothetical protein
VYLSALIEGIPDTTAEYTVRDVQSSSIGPAFVGQAIRDDQFTGYLTLIKLHG